MAEEKVRIRLVFENRRILSKCQKKEGLNRSWIVLNPKCHRTISEFADHLLRTFSLSEACPYGISLYMDGFVLPPFESICILKDKDIICVKKKKEYVLEDFGEEDEENVDSGVMLLADEEFQKETGRYDSESEEDELEEKAEEPVLEKKNSKKRKASSKSISSKRKKCKLATTEESPDERENTACVTKIKVVKKKKKKKKSLDEQRVENVEQNNGDAKSMTSSKSSSQREESKGPHDQCQMSAETKKTPSRSARRKKAKRQWLREKAKLEKEELQQKQLAVAPIQKSLITVDYHQVTEKSLENHEADEEGDDVGVDVTPVEVRPGHIRFKPLAGTDQASIENESPTENFMWNGNMTKKKGQKWGTEKTGYAKRYAQDFNEDISHDQTAEVEIPAARQIDFEQLKAYTCSVKKGDVIAYRLIELSSSWTPEVSSYRVGKISQYDPDSKKVTLIPVQEFPIEKKTEDEDEDSSMQPETSLYKEDGSLEIEFSALLDVRSVNTSSSDSTEVENNTMAMPTPTPKPNQTTTNLKLSANNGSHTPVKENEKNGKVNPWEELSEALSAKKAELSQTNNGWNKKGNSTGGGSWSYKALRGSALGPVMNYLRSQKEI